MGAETHCALMQSQALDCGNPSLPLREDRRPSVGQTRQYHACIAAAAFHSELPGTDRVIASGGQKTHIGLLD